ncbi:MAG TPA: hypothetical protein DC034_01210, partial [Clostridium sp.]|nr:hypothetical protein [Clostridium sp.]
SFYNEFKELANYKYMESGNKLRIAAFGSVSRKYELSDSAKKMFGFLDDIIDLYEFYNENK